MRGIYLQGRNSPSVNMHWRRFAVSELPKDAKEFDHWLTKRWQEKDAILEHYAQNGRFPADEGTDYVEVHQGGGVKQMVQGAGYIETHVKPKHPLEFLQIFAPIAAFGLLVHLLRRFWNWTLVAVGRG
jgi:lysocardiolipin and lysophospholipid acyltransferase